MSPDDGPDTGPDNGPENTPNDHPAEPTPPSGTMLAVSVGNTTTRVALVEGLGVRGSDVASTDAPEAVGTLCVKAAELAEADPPTGVMLASTDHTATPAIVSAIRAAVGLDVQRFNAELPIPIATDVTERDKVGQDRLLAALGAYAIVQQACIVVDAGTALTVDFVDGQGIFHGGAIVPGGQLMLDALGSRADALPSLVLTDMPDPLEPFGKSTEHAMLLGARAAVRGTVRYLAEQYAVYYEAYPQIVATGGDAEALLAGDELVEHIVPDLVLLGMAAARARLAADDADHDA